MFHQPDLFEAVEAAQDGAQVWLDLPPIIERIADISPRPRYNFIVLNLIAKAAGSNSGSAGPYVTVGGRCTPLRDWMCDALVPMAQREPRRRMIVKQFRARCRGQPDAAGDIRPGRVRGRGIGAGRGNRGHRT